MGKRKGFLQGAIHDQIRFGDGFPYPRQSLDGTGDNIDGQQIEEEDEPPGMIHVEKSQGAVKLELGRTDLLQVFLLRALGNNGADYRCRRQADKEGYGEFQGTEKIP